MVSLEGDPAARQFLNVVDEEDGRAATSTIRAKTDLSEGELQYRYRKLEKMGLIDVEYDGSLTGKGEPEMKIAVLTDLAKEEIDKGLLVETKQEQAKEPDIFEMVEELEALEEDMAEMQEMLDLMEDIEELDAIIERVEECEETVDELRGTLNDAAFPALRMLRTSVGRIEVALAEADIDVSSVEVSEAKERELLQRLEDERRA